MKLRIPHGLRAALLACFSAVPCLTTFGTASIAGGVFAFVSAASVAVAGNYTGDVEAGGKIISHPVGDSSTTTDVYALGEADTLTFAGISGWLPAQSNNNIYARILLSEGGLTISDGSVQTYTFHGAISGSGQLMITEAPSGSVYVFQGDMADYNGAISVTTPNPTLRFKNTDTTARTINASSISVQGTTEFEGNFNVMNAVTLAATTVKSGTTTLSGAGSTITALTVSGGATLCLSGAGTLVNSTVNLNASNAVFNYNKTAGAGYDALTSTFTGSGTFKVSSGMVDVQGAVTAGSATLSGGAKIKISSAFTTTGMMQLEGDGTHLDVEDTLTVGDDGIKLKTGSSMTVSKTGTVNTGRLVVHNLNQATTETVIIDGGTVNITGTGGAGEQAAFLVGHWSSGSNISLTLKSGELNVLNGTTSITWDSAATLAINGGTANLKEVSLTSNSRQNAATLKMTGGQLNIGSGGIINASGDNKKIEFYGGTLGVIDSNWTLASGAKMQVMKPAEGSAGSGTLTIDTATKAIGAEGDDNYQPSAGRIITLAGAVEGDGDIKKVGEGTLVFSGATDGYTGKLTVEAGAVQAEAWNGTQTITLDGGALTGRFSHGTVEGSGSLANFNLDGGTIDFGTLSAAAEGAALKATGTLTLTSGSFLVQMASAALAVDDSGAITLTLLEANEGASLMLGSGATWEHFSLNGTSLTEHGMATSMEFDGQYYDATLSITDNNTLTLNLAAFGNVLTWGTGNGTWDEGGQWGNKTYDSSAVVVFDNNTDSEAITLTSNVSAHSVVVKENGTYTFEGSGSLFGELPLEVSGNLTISNENENWRGSADVRENGRLTLGNDKALGSSTLHLGGGTLAGSANIDNEVIVNADSTVDVAGEQTLTLSGTISGEHGLTKSGEGTLKLAAANAAFTGGVDVTAGTLQAAVAGALKNASSITLSGGSLLIDDGNTGAALAYTHAGTVAVGSASTITVASGDSLTLSGVLSGSALLTLSRGGETGSGTVTLSNTGNSLSGGIVVENGITLKAGNSNGVFGNRNSSPNSAGNTVTIKTGGVVDVNSKDELNYNFVLAGGSLLNDNTSGTPSQGSRNIERLTLSANSTIGGEGSFYIIGQSYNAAYINLGGYTLTKTGEGTVRLYNPGVTGTAGTIDIQEGVLGIARGGALGNTAFKFSGGDFWFGRANKTDASSLTIAGAVSVVSNADISVWSGDSLTLSGVLSGSGSLTLKRDGSSGTATVTLSNTGSAHTGGIVVEDGVTLKAGASGAVFGKSNVGNTQDGNVVTIKSGGIVDINGHTDVTHRFTLAGGSLLNNGTSVANANQRNIEHITLTANSTMGSTVDGGGDFFILGSNHGKTTIALDGHTLTKAGGNVITLYSTEVTGGGTINITGGTLKVTRYATDKLFTTFAAGTHLSIDDGAAFEIGYASTDTEENTLNVASLSGAGTLNLGSQASKTFKVTTAESQTYTFSGNISGSGKLEFAGEGTQKLSGTNTYTGATTISGGTLSLASSGALGASSSLTFSGGNLEVTDNNAETSLSVSYGNAVTLNSAATITVGDKDSLALSGVVSGGGALTKDGAGTLSATTLTASGAVVVESGKATVNTLTLNEGASLELVNDGSTLALGSLVDGRAASSTAAAPEVKLLGGTLGAASAEAGFSTELAVTLGAVELGSSELTGSITLGGAVNFVNTATYNTSVTIDGTKVEISSEGLSELARHSASVSTHYSNATTGNGYLGGTYTLLEKGENANEGATLTISGLTDESITVHAGGADATLSLTNDGKATLSVAGKSGTYFINNSATYTLAEMGGADDIYVASGQTLTFNGANGEGPSGANGSGSVNDDWGKDIDLAGASLMFETGSMNDSSRAVTLHSSIGEDGETVYSENTISMKNSTLAHTIDGVGNLTLKKPSGTFNLNSLIQHEGNLTLEAGITIQDNAEFNNKGTLTLKGYQLNSDKIGDNVTGIALKDSSKLTMAGTQAVDADMSHITADATSTLSVQLDGTVDSTSDGSSVALADDFAGTLEVTGGSLLYGESLGEASIRLNKAGLIFRGNNENFKTQDFAHDIEVLGESFVGAWGNDGNTANNIISGALTGGGTLMKIDTGWVTLENISGFTGNFNVTIGRLILNLDANDGTFSASRVTIGSGTLKLKGTGTYELADATTMTSQAGKLSVTDDWTGKVKLTGDGLTGATAYLALENYGRAGSTIELTGVVGYLNGGKTTTANLVLTDLQSGNATYSAIKINNGSSDTTMTFSGSVEGSGTFERDTSGANMNNLSFKFTGDVSKWDGAFKYTNSQNSPTTSVEFSGKATEVNADITKAENAPGTLKATFDNTDMTNGMTVNSQISGATQVTYSGTGATTVTGKNGASDYTGGTTISASEVKVASSKALGSGNVVVSNNAKLSVDSTTGLDLGKSATVTVDNGGSLVVKPVADADDANAVARLEYKTNAAAATAATLQGAKLTAKGIEAYADATVKSITGAKLTITSAYMVSGITLDDSEILFGSAEYEEAIAFADLVINANAAISSLDNSFIAEMSGANTLWFADSTAQIQEVNLELGDDSSVQTAAVEGGSQSYTSSQLNGIALATGENNTLQLNTTQALDYTQDATFTFTGLTGLTKNNLLLGDGFGGYTSYEVTGGNTVTFLGTGSGGGSAAIPEPATATLSLLALAACAAHRRRRSAAAR